jgi:AcrR family transcriptional regulator
MSGAYRQAQQHGRAHVRATLLDAASRLLVAEGIAALSMRRVAAEVGCSTTVLYTLFGGKEGLANGLYQEGFERFRRRLTELPPSTDPLTHTYALAAAYRDHALAEPHYYRVMFCGAVPGFTPTGPALAAAADGFAVLVDNARACVDAGLFTPDDPHAIAQVLWAAAHGVISLELAGLLTPDDAARRFQTATRAATRWFVPDTISQRGTTEAADRRDDPRT